MQRSMASPVGSREIIAGRAADHDVGATSGTQHGAEGAVSHLQDVTRVQKLHRRQAWKERFLIVEPGHKKLVARLVNLDTEDGTQADQGTEGACLQKVLEQL